MKRLLLLAVCLFVLTSGYEDRGEKSAAEALDKSGISSSRVMHRHELDDAVIVFYEDPDGGLNAGLIDKKGSRFQWGFGGGTVSPQNGSHWAWINLDMNSKTKRYQLYYGVLQDESVRRLHIRHKGINSYIDKDAELVRTSAGYTLWFALQDRYSEVHPGFELDGYSADGERVYRYE
ncbi:hypothetical protein [Paenibacillus sp. GYB003]|uniref:hypothetical protein n=1 Tax=Paenibacillus sp. GYB003 TaxID=2994392 RepID=UPI002F96A9B9